ncbi:MAG: TetR/AcrR family transcriptional regulator [Desulfovibrionales bacterium]
MPGARIIPIDQPQTTKQQLFAAVGRLLAAKGFQNIAIEDIVFESGVDRAVIFRAFGGLEGLVAAFGRSEGFWPDSGELLPKGPEELQGMEPKEQIGLCFKRLLKALLRRPQTLDILAWEVLERTPLSRRLEEVRVRTSLEFFEHLQGDIPDDVDLSAVVLVLAAAVMHLAISSRVRRTLGGVDLQSGEGWQRIDEAIDLLVSGIF